MRKKAATGDYSSWDALAADLDLMFSNALAYNLAGDAVWAYTQKIKAQVRVWRGCLGVRLLVLVVW